MQVCILVTYGAFYQVGTDQGISVEDKEGFNLHSISRQGSPA
jgi:hypothetical protein